MSTDPVAPDTETAETPTAVTAAGGFRDRYAVLLLLAALALVHVGIWRGSGYLGDVGVFVAKADALNQEGRVTSNPYLTVHQLALLIAPYPLDAHNLVRILASLLSTLGLYGMLRASRLCRPMGALAASVLWIANILCVPYAQIALSNLFAYSLALCGLAWLAGGFTWRRWLAAVGGAYLAARCRPEYLGVLALLLGLAGLQLLAQAWRARRGRAVPGIVPTGRDWLAAAALAVLLLVCSALPSPERSGGTDAYLLLGFHQSYALYHNRTHGAEAFVNPWLESQPLTAREFGDPEGLSDVVRHEPAKFLRYIWDNSRHNLPYVLPGIMETRTPPGGHHVGLNMTIMGRILAGLVLACALAAGVAAVRRRRAAHGAEPQHSGRESSDPLHPAIRVEPGAEHQVLHDNRVTGGAPPVRGVGAEPHELPILLDARVHAFAVLVIAAGLPVLMYGREPRLFVSLVPLAYLPLAWALGDLLGRLPHVRWAWLACGLLAVVMCRPLFPGRPSNRPLIDALRARGLALSVPDAVYLGGPNSRELGGLALGARQRAHINLDDQLIRDLLEGRFHFFVHSLGLERSMLFRQNEVMFDHFLRAPGDFGYEAVAVSEADGEYLVLFQRVPALPPARAGGL